MARNGRLVRITLNVNYTTVKVFLSVLSVDIWINSRKIMSFTFRYLSKSKTYHRFLVCIRAFSGARFSWWCNKLEFFLIKYFFLRYTQFGLVCRARERVFCVLSGSDIWERMNVLHSVVCFHHLLSLYVDVWVCNLHFSELWIQVCIELCKFWTVLKFHRRIKITIRENL